MKMLLILLLVGVMMNSAIANAATVMHLKATPQHHRQQKLSVININKASLKELTQLKGIGKKRANVIVNHRIKHGRFKTIDGLLAVKGMSKRQLTRLKKLNAGKIAV